MAELFENFVDDIGLIPRLKIARETYIDGLHEEVHERMRAEAREEVRAEGLARVNRLAQMLVEQDRMEDLKRSFQDSKYRESLFKEFDL